MALVRVVQPTALVPGAATLFRWPCQPSKSAWCGNSPAVPKCSLGWKIFNIEQGRTELINSCNTDLLDIYQRKYAFFKAFINYQGQLVHRGMLFLVHSARIY